MKLLLGLSFFFRRRLRALKCPGEFWSAIQVVETALNAKFQKLPWKIRQLRFERSLWNIALHRIALPTAMIARPVMIEVHP